MKKKLESDTLKKYIIPNESNTTSFSYTLLGLYTLSIFKDIEPNSLFVTFVYLNKQLYRYTNIYKHFIAKNINERIYSRRYSKSMINVYDIFSLCMYWRFEYETMKT